MLTIQPDDLDSKFGTLWKVSERVFPRASADMTKSHFDHKISQTIPNTIKVSHKIDDDYVRTANKINPMM